MPRLGEGCASRPNTLRRSRLVEIALLYCDDCPNWRLVDERLREALRLVGREEARVERRLVATHEDAEAIRFHGSPTVHVNGQDPFTDPHGPVGLTCRVGLPTVAQLVEVLA